MMNIEIANKMMADACGVEETHRYMNGSGSATFGWLDNGKFIHGKWTIEDPRCCQIVREKFKIITTPTTDSHMWLSGVNSSRYSTGKTIADTEIAAILSICEELTK